LLSYITLNPFSVAGFLCHKAGRIPAIGTRIIVFREMEDSVRFATHSGMRSYNILLPSREPDSLHKTSDFSL